MTLLLIGLGSLGGLLLDRLACDQGVRRIVAAGRDAARGQARANLARVSAVAEGRAPGIEFAPLDACDAAAVAALVDRVRPDVIVTTVTLQTWWLIDLLPPSVAAPLRLARFGAWLPVHLAPTLAVMRGLRDARYRGVTLTAPYPDVVNTVLARVGLAPACGVGNLDEIEPKVRVLAAERLRVQPDRIQVTLVAHHALERFVYGGSQGEPPPYLVRVACDGCDVTREVGADNLLFSPFALPSTPAWHVLTASSALRLVRALRSPTPMRLHAPGPCGLPGGYPIVVSAEGVQVAPIEGMSLQDAVALNEHSHRWDGIDRVEPDGTVVLCEEDAGVLRNVLGYDGARLAPDEAEARGRELADRFRAFALKAGIDLERARRGI